MKETPYGDYKSACYDSDFYDGSLDNPLREPAGPTKGWFSPLWERDFPAMKELGVNTVRLYNANPTTRYKISIYTLNNLYIDYLQFVISVPMA